MQLAVTLIKHTTAINLSSTVPTYHKNNNEAVIYIYTHKITALCRKAITCPVLQKQPTAIHGQDLSDTLDLARDQEAP